ncbi:hypothetical protein H6G64_34205 [Calothrix sp. FACHB-156]|nr:hypothetical protein [Calothrix sp. FACHB-156]
MFHPEMSLNADELIKDIHECLENHDCIPGAKKNLPLLKMQKQSLEHFAIEMFRASQELQKLIDVLEQNESRLT